VSVIAKLSAGNGQSAIRPIIPISKQVEFAKKKVASDQSSSKKEAWEKERSGTEGNRSGLALAISGKWESYSAFSRRETSYRPFRISMPLQCWKGWRRAAVRAPLPVPWVNYTEPRS